MFERDAASQALGMQVVSAADGRATLAMTVRDDMVNGLQTCHGGLIFSLADSAMAFASNAGNERAFAVHAAIDWVNPATLGMELTATATAIMTRGRTVLHDVKVTAQDGTVIALFRGQTRRVGGTHLPPG